MSEPDETADLTHDEIAQPHTISSRGRLIKIINVLRHELTLAGRVILEQRREIHWLRDELHRCKHPPGPGPAKQVRIMFGTPTKRKIT